MAMLPSLFVMRHESVSEHWVIAALGIDDEPGRPARFRATDCQSQSPQVGIDARRDVTHLRAAVGRRLGQVFVEAWLNRIGQFFFEHLGPPHCQLMALFIMVFRKPSLQKSP